MKTYCYAYIRTKKRAYDQRIREAEHDYFTPLVFSASRGGSSCHCHEQTSAWPYLLSIKREESYTTVIAWPSLLLSPKICSYVS